MKEEEKMPKDEAAPKRKTTRQRRPAAEREPIQYLVNMAQGEDIIIELDPTWRLTFSSVNPQSQGNGFREGYCLRIYEGEKLRTVMANVTGFRDLTIPFARKVKSETGTASWSKDSRGNFKEEKTKQIEESIIVDNTDLVDF